MHIYECYRLLGLPRNSSSDDIKTAYRRLARKYHPDLNANDPAMAEKFREVQEAYRILKELGDQPATKTAYQEQKVKVQVVDMPHFQTKDQVQTKDQAQTRARVSVRTEVPKAHPSPESDQKLKLDLLKRVKELLLQKKIVATIPIVEGLRERYPSAPEVIHWQAVAYYRWGSELLIQGRLREAEIYLKKVLTTDPSNRELCFEAKRDLERIS